jgi:hypothetical protein
MSWTGLNWTEEHPRFLADEHRQRTRPDGDCAGLPRWRGSPRSSSPRSSPSRPSSRPGDRPVRSSRQRATARQPRHRHAPASRPPPAPPQVACPLFRTGRPAQRTPHRPRRGRPARRPASSSRRSASTPASNRWGACPTGPCRHPPSGAWLAGTPRVYDRATRAQPSSSGTSTPCTARRCSTGCVTCARARSRLCGSAPAPRCASSSTACAAIRRHPSPPRPCTGQRRCPNYGWSPARASSTGQHTATSTTSSSQRISPNTYAGGTTTCTGRGSIRIMPGLSWRFDGRRRPESRHVRSAPAHRDERGRCCVRRRTGYRLRVHQRPDHGRPWA